MSLTPRPSACRKPIPRSVGSVQRSSMSDLNYATSSALSTSQFKLVKALERSTSDTERSRLLLTELARIKSRVSVKPSKHDLIVGAFCLAELDGIASSGHGLRLQYDEHKELFLVQAIGLAGQDSRLAEKRLGYTLTAGMFDTRPHPLKLLLVNSIRDDLHSKDERRCVIALRAVTSPNLISLELIPAIQDKIIDLLSSSSSNLRRLAFAASLSLLRITNDSDSNLLSETKSFVLASLYSSPSASTTTETDPSLLSSLVASTSSRSILFPLVNSESDLILHSLIKILSRVIHEGSTESDNQILALPWLSLSVLEQISDELSRRLPDTALQRRTFDVITEYISTIVDKADIAFGLFLSSLRALSHVSLSCYQSLMPPQSIVVAKVAARIRHHLLSTNPNLQLLAIKCLILLPSHIWMRDGDDAWGAPEWNRIMTGLDSHDALIRKASLKLIYQIDPNVYQSHRSRLVASLASLSNGKSRQQQDVVISRALETVFTIETVGDWNDRIVEILDATKRDDLIGVIVLGTIEMFRYLAPRDQRLFGEAVVSSTRWKKDATLSLIVAGSCGAGDTSDARRSDLIEELTAWLINDSPVILHEPFLLCLLRLVSRLSDLSSDTIASLYDILSLAPALTASQHILDLFSDCTSPDGLTALLHAGLHPESSTLPGFYSVLERSLRTGSEENEPTDVPPTTLRYTAYQPSSSPTRLTSSQSSTLIGRGSSHGRERERTERGGRGGAMSESLMTAGALALAVGGELDDGSDNDSESERSQIISPVSIAAPSSDLLEAVDPFLDGN